MTILHCTECDTKYVVPDESIGKDGRKVKCTNCGHIWVAYTEHNLSEEQSEEDLENIPDESDIYSESDDDIQEPENELDSDSDDITQLPSQEEEAPESFKKINANDNDARHKTENKTLKIIAVASCIFAIVSAFISLNTNIFGLKEKGVVIFHNVTMEKVREGNRLNFNIEGILENRTNQQQEFPEIHIIVLSAGGYEMGSLTMQPTKEFLEPHEKVTVFPGITGVSGNAKKIILKI